MAYTPQSWRKLYSLADKQIGQPQLLGWCEKSRHLMHERLIELSADGPALSPEAYTERTEIENNLRKVWQIEQNARKAQP